jgi:predicted DNA repair protein MutK
VVLAVVGVLITAVVYGAVAVIVKADDVGAALARRHGGPLGLLGRGLVKGMPPVLAGLSVVGTLAMLWGGRADPGPRRGHLRLARPRGGDPPRGRGGGPRRACGEGALLWLVTAALSGVVGVALGLAVLGVLRVVRPAGTGQGAH